MLRNVRVEIESGWLLSWRFLSLGSGEIGATDQGDALLGTLVLTMVATIRELGHVIDAETQALLKGWHLGNIVLLLLLRRALLRTAFLVGASIAGLAPLLKFHHEPFSVATLAVLAGRHGNRGLVLDLSLIHI